ncbi:hypothetical protein HS7_07060 [Sulfolobales archaeon HS-7]|nr:hypothetical protein HS7_07060 [Sulfolobales archaeon HS-7]
MRIYDRVYIIEGESFGGGTYNSYLFNEGYWFLVNGGLITSTNLMINNILEITKGHPLRYIIITSCIRELAENVKELYMVFNPDIIAGYPDSVRLRRGECGNSPVEIAIEVRNEIRIGKIRIVRSKSPTSGSIIIESEGGIFSGLTKVSPLYQKSYLFSSTEYIRYG